MRPDLPSPWRGPGGLEAVVAATTRGEWAIVPVPLEDGPPFEAPGGPGSPSLGRGRQLEVDVEDFPTLARTGFHSRSELRALRTITGSTVERISEEARPGRLSGAGFLSAEEDIVSVLLEDDALARRLGLAHAELARPLFHVWNLILRELELGRSGVVRDSFRWIEYNGHRVAARATRSKNRQVSLFADEIRGSFDIAIRRDPTARERAYLEARYSRLSAGERDELVAKLSRLRTSEMEPFYIHRYGFYEGHTPYRTDPLAIAFVFGLAPIETIDAAAGGRLLERLTTPYAPVRRAGGS